MRQRLPPSGQWAGVKMAHSKNWNQELQELTMCGPDVFATANKTKLGQFLKIFYLPWSHYFHLRGWKTCNSLCRPPCIYKLV